METQSTIERVTKLQVDLVNLVREQNEQVMNRMDEILERVSMMGLERPNYQQRGRMERQRQPFGYDGSIPQRGPGTKRNIDMGWSRMSDAPTEPELSLESLSRRIDELENNLKDQTLKLAEALNMLNGRLSGIDTKFK